MEVKSFPPDCSMKSN